MFDTAREWSPMLASARSGRGEIDFTCAARLDEVPMRRDTILICAPALFLTPLYTGVAAPFDSLVAVALAQGGQTPPPTQTAPALAPRPPGSGRPRSRHAVP